MVDLSQFTTVAGLAVLIALLVQVVKPALEPRILPYVAIVLGVVLALVIGLATSALGSLQDIVSYGIGGLLAALVAIGGYESTVDKLKL